MFVPHGTDGMQQHNYWFCCVHEMSSMQTRTNEMARAWG